MIKRMLLAALAAAACVVGVVAAHASTAAAAPPCVAAHLRPSYGGFDGAAGTFQDTWRLRNVGQASCLLNGYPGVTNYRADGRPLPTRVSHLGTPHAVLLAPGEHASFALRYTDPGVVNCTPEPAARLTVLPPGSARPLITNRGEKACKGVLRETPLVHGG